MQVSKTDIALISLTTSPSSRQKSPLSKRIATPSYKLFTLVGASNFILQLGSTRTRVLLPSSLTG